MLKENVSLRLVSDDGKVFFKNIKWIGDLLNGTTGSRVKAAISCKNNGMLFIASYSFSMIFGVARIIFCWTR